MKKNCLVVFTTLSFIYCSSSVRESQLDPFPHFLAIESIRKSKPVDFTGIEQTYRTHLADFVNRSDSLIDTRIRDAIDEGLRGNKVHVQSQKVSKLLQKVFFDALIRSLRKLSGLSDQNTYAAEIQWAERLYNCLKPTVVRRSEWIGKGRELDDAIRFQLDRLASKPDEKRITKASQALETSLIRTYVLSVFYELEGIENNRGVDTLKCEEKEVEGRIFFETVEKYVESEELRNLIWQSLYRRYDELDVAEVRKLLAEAFPLYVSDLVSSPQPQGAQP